MLLTDKYQRVSSPVSPRILDPALTVPKPERRHGGDHGNLPSGWSTSLLDEKSLRTELTENMAPVIAPVPAVHPQEVDPLYLLACHLEWERREDPTAGWELLAAAQSSHADTRAHARALLASSRHMGGSGLSPVEEFDLREPWNPEEEVGMKAPYGLEIIESCSECMAAKPGFFCAFSNPILKSLDDASHKSTLPAGTILFVEGQPSRGVFILCSGRVNLSATSREGKILILKSAEAGDVLGLSAAISGTGYEVTAETATPCQLNFVDRKHFVNMMQCQNEVGMHVAQSLSREFQSAYRDIHNLVLIRTSAGKLAKLLLMQSPEGNEDFEPSESRLHFPMTHEEMAQRIGSSRETVTRLLTRLKRRHLIRLDGPTIVIRDRTGLAALTV